MGEAMWLFPQEMKIFPWRTIHQHQTCGRLQISRHTKTQVEEAHSSKRYDNRKGFMSNYLQRCITKHSAFLQLKAYSGFFFFFWRWQARHKFCITVVQTPNENICLNHRKCRALKYTKSWLRNPSKGN